MGKIATRRDNPVKYQDHNGRVHLCEEAEMPRGSNWFWTLCGVDVPADKAFIRGDEPNCFQCLKLAAPIRAAVRT